MRADDLFTFEESFLEEGMDPVSLILSEGIAETEEEAEALLNESVASTISQYMSRYSGTEPPEVQAFRDPRSRSSVVVLASGSNMHFRFDILNGKVVSEERYANFRELVAERDVLLQTGHTEVDHRSFLKRNWKKILGSIVGGTIGILVGGPLIVAMLGLVAGALATLAKFAAIAGVVVGTGWLMNKISQPQGT